MKKKLTIGEIAKKVGVSKAVVSAVLNRKENQRIFVSEEKKKKILELAKDIKYFPRKSAKELVTGQTNTIGVIIQRFTPYFSNLVEELQKIAFKKGYEIVLYLTENIPEKEEEFLNLMLDGRVDGIIVTSFTEGSEKRYKKYSEYLKILTMTEKIDNIPSVHFDEKKAGEIAAEYLIKTGCKKLCIAGGGKDFGRVRGFIEYCRKKGKEVSLLIEEKFSGYYEDGIKLAKKLFEMKELPEGIFAFNDLIGVALISEIKEKGLKIPEDISIISCDNTEICLYTEPKLTSIDTKFKERAEKAIENFIKIKKGEKVEDVVIQPEIIIRGTTKKEVRI